MRRKLPFNTILTYLVAILSTTAILIIVGLALPQTEKYLKLPQNNVVSTDKGYVTEEHVIDVTIESTQLLNRWELINQTKNVITNRLSKYAVSLVEINYQELTETSGTLKVITRSSIPSANISSLITGSGDYRIVVKKADANFEDEKNPYAIYLPDSYDEVNLSKSDFRTVYITPLSTTTGDIAYFGIFKPWIWSNSKFDQFMKNNSGKEAGVNIDGFVTPLSIPVYGASASNGSVSAKPILTFGLGTEEDLAKRQSIVLNTQNIPLELTFKNSTVIDTDGINYNMYTAFGAMFLGILLFVLVVSRFYGNDILITFGTIVISFAFLVAFLKITQTPILSVSLLLVLPFLAIMSIIFNSELVDRKKLIVILLITTLLMAYPIKSVFVLYSQLLLYITTAVPLFTYSLNSYRDLIKTIISR